ncbi:hypothetical protein EV715DRAFT_292893 [Schizophyllum commune]
MPSTQPSKHALLLCNIHLITRDHVSLLTIALNFLSAFEFSMEHSPSCVTLEFALLGPSLIECDLPAPLTIS